MSTSSNFSNQMLSAKTTWGARPLAFAAPEQARKRYLQCYGGPHTEHAQAGPVLASYKCLSAAVLAAGLLAVTGPAPVQAAASNQSLIDQIHFQQAEKNANSTSNRPATPAQLLEAAAAQLGKIETLIGIGQYDSARLQLRQGAASTIRLDLRAYDRSQHAKPGDPQAGKAIVKEVETLDIALKQSKPADECRQLVRQIRHDMSELLATS